MENWDQEVLFKSSVLYKHLTDNNCVNYEILEDDSETVADQDQRAGIKKNTPKVIEDHHLTSFISHEDYTKICAIYHSKLLVLEDFEMVECLISKCVVDDSHPSPVNICLLIASGVLSFGLLYFKGTKIIPLSVASLSTGYLVWETLNRVYQSVNTKKMYNSIETLQTLCYNVHKLLRYLKETEILSTGQVTAENIGSAMYTPLMKRENLSRLPGWKTLPHIRQCLYCSLIEVTDIFISACNILKEHSPSWLDIKGFTFMGSTCENQKEEDSVSKDECVPISKLQSLNEAYLKIQSEFLRWVAFNMCPFNWTDSVAFKQSKNEIFQLLLSVSEKLNPISHKLRLQFDLINMFSNYGPKLASVSRSILLNKNFELRTLQNDLHKLFLSTTLMLHKTKEMEDYCDTVSKTSLEKPYDADKNFGHLNKSLASNLYSVKNDLMIITKEFEEILTNLNPTNNLRKNEYEDEQIVCRSSSVEVKNEKPNNSESENKFTFDINCPDEVFLAISGTQIESSTDMYDETWFGKKPKVPPSLLNELVTTLEPIKKDFQEREKLALERSGLQEIKDDSYPETKTKKQSYLPPTSLNTQNINASHHKEEDSEKTETFNSLKEMDLHCSRAHNVSSLAEALKTQSENFLNEEQFYSDDEFCQK